MAAPRPPPRRTKRGRDAVDFDLDALDGLAKRLRQEKRDRRDALAAAALAQQALPTGGVPPGPPPGQTNVPPQGQQPVPGQPTDPAPEVPVGEPEEEITVETVIDKFITDYGGFGVAGIAIANPALREYIRDWLQYPTGDLSIRIAGIIQAMMESSGIGDAWNGGLPIHIFLLHWSHLQHPWVIDDTPEVEWLQAACAMHRAGATEVEMEEFLGLFEQFKALAVPGTHPLIGPVNRGAGSTEDHLVGIREQIWGYAVQGADSYANDIADADDIRDQLVDRQAVDVDMRGSSPARLLWDILWSQARRTFVALNPAPADQTRWNVLFEGAYRAAYLSRRYHFPSTTTAERTAQDICTFINNTRMAARTAATEQWQQGNIKIKSESDVSYENRRAIYMAAPTADWGHGPYDEALWPARMERVYDAYIVRLEAELSEDDALWDTEVDELHFLKGRSSIQILLPYWLQDMPGNRYVTSVLKPVMFWTALSKLEPQWQAAFIAARTLPSEFEPSEAELRATHATVLTASNNLSGYPFGPNQERASVAWNAFLDQLLEDVDGVLRGRFEDMRDDVNTTSWRYGGDAVLPPPRAVDESDPRLCRRALSIVTKALDTQCHEAWEAAVAATPVGVARDAMNQRYQSMKDFHSRDGRWYRPHDDEPMPSRAQDIAKNFGPGTGRGGPAGNWVFHSKAGSGTFGHAGVWVQKDDANTVIARMVMKETYLGIGWNRAWLWNGEYRWRFPEEFRIVDTLKRYQDSDNIIRYISYGIYERFRMHRIYMELCPHQDLRQLMKIYQRIKSAGETDGNGVLIESRIPVRMLWSIFEGLVTALYLMQVGSLPGLSRLLQEPDGTFHRDLKPANIFLAAPNPNYWRGIPVAKMADFGMAVRTTSSDFNMLAGRGTRGYRAPEQVVYPEGHVDRGHGHPVSMACDIWVVGRIMLSLMNLQSDAIDQQELSSIPAIAAFAPGIEDFYGPDLCRFVRGCLASDPTQRINIRVLYRDLHTAVASYRGL